jgi:metal-responsive CopG/Arc/MetJ family transcriptional regulator
MSKLISIKIDPKTLEETDIMVNKLGMSRNKYINEAIEAYTKAKKRAELEKQIRKEIKNIAESSMEVLAEFEDLEDDYETI